MSEEYTGKDVSYYLVTIHKPKRLDPYTAECEDIIEALGMSFAEGCAFKAIWRKCAARTLGLAKAGYKGGLYDAEKTQYYGARMVAAEQAKTKGVHQHGETIIVSTPEQRTALYAALNSENQRVTPVPEDIYAHSAARTDVPGSTAGRKVGKAAGLGMPYTAEEHIKRAEAAQRKSMGACEACGYFVDGLGTHWATCPTLSAPQEHLEQAEAAFEEAAGTPAPEKVCRHCGSRVGAFHRADCHLMRQGKSQLAVYLTDLVVGQESAEFLGAVGKVIGIDETVEPAAAIDDDSPRMQAIGQNGNDGEHYDDPWAGAPGWAKYKAQDMDGCWYWYETEVYPSVGQWVERGSSGRLDQASGGEPNTNWRNTLIERPNNKSQE